jgi:hypothetical protein
LHQFGYAHLPVKKKHTTVKGYAVVHYRPYDLIKYFELFVEKIKAIRSSITFQHRTKYHDNQYRKAVWPKLAMSVKMCHFRKNDPDIRSHLQINYLLDDFLRILRIVFMLRNF